MDKLKTVLATLLLGIADSLTRLANKLNAPEENLFDLAQIPGGSFDTFKEGMASEDYRVRHQAATKLVSWYLLGNGQPVVQDLGLAARILLDEFDVNDGDLSRLVDCWIAQASATTAEERAKFELDEQKIYDGLVRTKAILEKETK